MSLHKALFSFIHWVVGGGAEQFSETNFQVCRLELKYVWVASKLLPCALCLAVATTLRSLVCSVIKDMHCGTRHPRLEKHKQCSVCPIRIMASCGLDLTLLPPVYAIPIMSAHAHLVLLPRLLRDPFDILSPYPFSSTHRHPALAVCLLRSLRPTFPPFILSSSSSSCPSGWASTR